MERELFLCYNKLVYVCPTEDIQPVIFIYNSYGLILCAHESFTSAEDAVSKESDIVSNRVAVHYTTKRRLVGDTDTGIALKEKIGELMQLLDAYRRGIIKEKK